jgi:hypothetical protein
MKMEISLSQAEHAYLLTAASHDRQFRSLQSFTKACLIRGLNAEAAQHLGTRRKEAVAALVGTANAKRRKL